MKNQALKIQACGGCRGSVLECGSPLPLLNGKEISIVRQSARGLAQSKTWRNFLVLLLFLATPVIAQAQSYSINWYKISGGGGTSTGATYQVTGTIGQPDASGVISGGNFSVTGGFWSLISVVQTPGAPLLTIIYSGNQAVVSWPFPSTGFTLQTNGNLAAGTWGNYGGTVGDNGTIKTATNSPPTGTLFFRLSHP